MPHSVHHVLAMLLIFSAAVQAESRLVQRQITVVYEGRSTISAQPYYQQLKRKDAAGRSRVAVPAGAEAVPLNNRLPLSSTRLSVGRPEMKAVPGLTTPLFVMGMDARSLRWFSQAAQGLADIGARGVVVQASRPEPWRALHQQARTLGIDLVLMDGDALADGYGISSYPVVLIRPELAREGMHE